MERMVGKMTWVDVKGYEGLYQINSFGVIRSLPRMIKQGRRIVCAKGKVLTQCNDGRGYMIVVLSKNGIHKSIRVHRLVADAFLPNPESKTEVNHIDGNKANNRVSNLEWATRNENMSHAFTTGLAKIPPAQEPKKVAQYTKNGILVNIFSSIKHAGKHTGTDASDICNCCRGKRKTAGGFAWQYAREEAI
jgi:hypothetical protein